MPEGLFVRAASFNSYYRAVSTLFIFTAAFLLMPRISDAQTVDPSLYQSMRWRMIGPFRAGRTVGAAGIPSQPNVFYIGVNNGGVWKTTDAGRTWQPIFDDQPTGSIGDIAIAPSNPNVIYVGSGEGLAAAGSFDRRRHVQINRRRQDVGASRPARRPADRLDRGRPEGREPVVRRRARPSVRPE